jgi:hypothetical protein
MFFPWAVGAFYWYIVWFVILYAAVRRWQNPILKIKENKLLFAVAVLLILGASSNPDTRRIMAIYPIIFLVFSGYYMQLRKGTKNKMILGAFATYGLLLIIYNFIK